MLGSSAVRRDLSAAQAASELKLAENLFPQRPDVRVHDEFVPSPVYVRPFWPTLPSRMQPCGASGTCRTRQRARLRREPRRRPGKRPRSHRRCRGGWHPLGGAGRFGHATPPPLWQEWGWGDGSNDLVIPGVTIRDGIARVLDLVLGDLGDKHCARQRLRRAQWQTSTCRDRLRRAQ